MNKIQFTDIFIVVFVTFMWALCFPLISTGLSDAPPLLYATLRSLIAGLTFLLPAVFLGKGAGLTGRLWLVLIFTGFTYAFLGFGGMFLGGQNINPGLATTLANTQPLIAAVLAYFFLSEKLHAWGWLGLFLGFTGILAVSRPAFFQPGSWDTLEGIAFILMGALGTAVGNVLLKKLAGQVPIFLAVGSTFLFGALFLGLASIFYEGFAPVRWDLRFIVTLLVLAIPGTAIATTFWLYLLERNPLSRLNAFTFLAPGFALLIGFFFFQEKLSLWEAGGIVLILSGVLLVNKRNAFLKTGSNLHFLRDKGHDRDP